MINSDYIFNRGGVLKSNGYAISAEAIILSDPLTAHATHDHDLVQDIFTKNTNFGHARDANLYYDHGMHPQLGDVEYGVGVIKMDAGKVFFEGELDRRAKYVDHIKELIEQGKLGISTGVAPHLYKARSIGNGINEIMHWVVSDVSLTAEPCEPRTIATMKSLYTLKSYTPVLYDFSKNNMISLLKEFPPSSGDATKPAPDAAAPATPDAPDVAMLKEKAIQAVAVEKNFEDRFGDSGDWDDGTWRNYIEVRDATNDAMDSVRDFYDSEAAANEAAQAAKDAAANGGDVTKNLKIGAPTNAQRRSAMRGIATKLRDANKELNKLQRELDPPKQEDVTKAMVRKAVAEAREEERKALVEKELQLKKYL